MEEALLMSRLDGMESKLLDQELRLVNAANEIVSLKQHIRRLESVPPVKSLLAKAAAAAVVNFSPRSCQEALDSGLPQYKDSGMYWIDPDGLGIGDGSIYVYCDMTTGQMITESLSAVITIDINQKELKKKKRCQVENTYF